MGIVVPAEGPKKCKLILVGQAPGSHEEYEGRPFCGPSGNFLNAKLHINRIARQECYVTNLSKIRPGTWWQACGGVWEGEKYAKPENQNDFSIFWKGTKPTKYLLQCKDSLLKELEDVDCSVILSLGGDALWALTGINSIGKYRGTALDLTLESGKKFKVIGAFHPANIFKPYKNMSPGAMGYSIQLDIKKAKRYAEDPSISPLERHLIIAPSYSDVVDFAHKCLSSDTVTFDIETSPENITCISLAYSESEAISIPLMTSYWGSFSRLREVYSHVHRVLTAPGIVKCGHNISFDIQYLTRFAGILPTKPWFDTMIAAHSCYSDLPKSLAFWTSVVTDEPYYKDDLKVWRVAQDSEQERLWTYNAKDAAVTFEIMKFFTREISDLGVKRTFDSLMDLLEPLIYIMLRGARISKEAASEHSITLTESLKDREAKFESEFGGVNPHSTKQVKELVYGKLGYTPVEKDGKVTVDKKALDKLSKQNPVVKEIIGIRADRKLISTYASVKTDAIDGRLRFSMNVTGAKTFRISSSESIFNCGSNIQNWPHKLRNIIIPEEGMTFTEVDLKGAEAMIVAYLSDDPFLIRLFEENRNIHLFTATHILYPGWSEEQIKEDKKRCESEGRDTESKYFIAKKVRHSGNYLASYISLMDTVKCSAATAKTFLRKFYEYSPCLTMWHRKVKEQLDRTRTIVTPLGDRIVFLGQPDVKMLREAVAAAPQSTVARVLNIGLCRVYSTLCKHKDINIINQVHDSILLEHPIEMTKEIHEQLPNLMRVDLTINGRNLYIPIEIKTGPNWRDVK